MPTKKRKLLSNTRPRRTQNTPSLSSRTTRTLIRTHHTLHKQLSHALATHNELLTTSIRAQIAAAGGLPTYQLASITGQSTVRGGDSSKVLVDWLSPFIQHRSESATENGVAAPKLRMLEVGALRTGNACARSGLFEVERIDLHSQHKDILEQDFMQRPIPGEESMEVKGFDVVSLSLVVNFVGDAAERGEMLRRVGKFLRGNGRGRRREEGPRDDAERETFPALFLVLPVSCVTNSRYLDEGRLGDIMVSLGYRLIHRKSSSKLEYYFWAFDGRGKETGRKFGKEKVRTGRARNNFTILLR